MDLNNNPNPSPEAVPFDIATGLVMLISRFSADHRADCDGR